MITIQTFSKPEEAHLLRARLESGGVRAFVQDENLVQMNWLYSNAIGGVRVQIAEEDVEDAMAILNEVPPPLTDALEVACPHCASTEVMPNPTPRRISFASVLFLGFPIVYSKHGYCCQTCGKAWNEKHRG